MNTISGSIKIVIVAFWGIKFEMAKCHSNKHENETEYKQNKLENRLFQ